MLNRILTERADGDSVEFAEERKFIRISTSNRMLFKLRIGIERTPARARVITWYHSRPAALEARPPEKDRNANAESHSHGKGGRGIC